MNDLAIRDMIERHGLPDNRQWTNRFELSSETSDRVYVIAQHKTGRHWGCSCPGWRRHRRCKHLATVGLPSLEKPHEVIRIAENE